MNRNLIYVLLLTIAGCNPETKSNDTESRITKIANSIQPNFQIEGEEVPEYHIEERLKMLGVPGINIAVVENGELAWARAYGMADVSEGRPVTTETLKKRNNEIDSMVIVRRTTGTKIKLDE